MMNSRLALHKIFEDILGNNHVYFQAPSKLSYPCIKYKLLDANEKHADNKKYLRKYEYEITLIHEDPDNNIVDKLLDLPHTTLIKTFSTQGLNHYIITIYYKEEKEIL